jgi:hypothetical protein
MIVTVYNWKAKEIKHICDRELALHRVWNVEPDGIFDESRPDADVILMEKVQLQKAKHTKIVPTWVRGHTNKRDTPYTDQEQINMRAEKLAGTVHKALPHDFTSHQDNLHFPEQHISLCLQGQKVTSKITRNVAHSFHRPKPEEHIKVREEWSQNTWDDIAWKSFTIAFNKMPTARPTTLTKLIFSFWCTNIQHQQNQGKILNC